MSVVDRKNTVLAAFTSFNPDIELLERAVISIKSQVTEVLIVDNGSLNKSDVMALAERNGLKCLSFAQNRGIAAAFNLAFKFAVEAGIDWVVTCDQDSIMPKDLVGRLLKDAIAFNEEYKIGIVCPNFFNRTTKTLEYCVEEPCLIDSCISSGSLTLVKAWDDISGFDEVMFIDGVDFEFCDRLEGAGYKILLDPSVHMEHEIGDIKLHGLPGHKFSVLNHSSFRKFYIAQNIIYRNGKGHGGHVSPVALIRVFKQVLLVFAYEDHKLDKLAAILRGSKSGLSLAKNIREIN